MTYSSHNSLNGTGANDAPVSDRELRLKVDLDSALRKIASLEEAFAKLQASLDDCERDRARYKAERDDAMLRADKAKSYADMLEESESQKSHLLAEALREAQELREENERLKFVLHERERQIFGQRSERARNLDADAETETAETATEPPAAKPDNDHAGESAAATSNEPKDSNSPSDDEKTKKSGKANGSGKKREPRTPDESRDQNRNCDHSGSNGMPSLWQLEAAISR